VHQTIKPKPVTSSKPVRLDQPAFPRRGIEVRLTSVRRITATARLPGEVAGPALAVAVSVDNESGKAADLRNVVVNLTDSSGKPASLLSTPPARPLTGQLRSGRVVEGVYVFTVARANQKTVTVTVSLAPDQRVVVFDGRVT
jgi:hypothetical protein